MLELVRTLSLGEIGKIRGATENILETVGFSVMCPELLSRARAAGANVDEAGGRVRFPAPLLRELLAQAPPSYVIMGLDGKEHIIGSNHQCCHAIVTDPWIIDYDTQQPRRPRLEDVQRHTRIAQQLEEVASVSLMDFPVTDFEGPASTLHAREQYLLCHAKHIYAYSTSIDDFHLWLRIKTLLEKNGPPGKGHLMTAAVAVVSPLTLAEANAEYLLLACQHNMPVIPTLSLLAGTTSPYSLAGTLLQANAEAVAVAALTQIVKPGHPFLYTVLPSVADMSTGADRYYTLDKVLWKITSGQLGKSYNLPVSAECGGTLNPRYDLQSGAEGVLFMLAAHACEANVLAGIGSCYNAIGMSGEMMLVQTAWLQVAKFLGRGIRTDDFHLGLESVRRAGPGANYLMDDLTVELVRNDEFFHHPLFDYSCEFGNGDSMLVRSHKMAEELVAAWRSPVSEKVQEAIRRFFAELYKQLEK